MISRTASEALVETDDASRYLTQLGRHFAHEADTRFGFVRVGLDDTSGFVGFGPFGTCSMHAESDGLRLRATARWALGLRVVQRIVTSHLEQLGRREGLVVCWHPTGGRQAR